MKGLPIFAVEVIIAVIIAGLGLSGSKVLFITSPRSAVITLGIIGMLFCTLSVGKFITSGPAHPLSILGYLLGAIAIAAFIIQIFNWKVPLLSDPQAALIILAVAMIGKGIIARFAHILI